MNYEDIKALNWSTLKHLAVSPKMLKWRSQNPQKDTAALALGRLIHVALLEPEKWAEYVREPDFGDKRKKETKAAAEAFRLENAGRVVIPCDDYDMAVRCAEEIRAHREAMDLLVGGKHEHTIEWVDADTGIKCKARLDTLLPGWIADIKSTRHQTPRKFLLDGTNLLYYGAMSWYHDGAIAAGVLPAGAKFPAIVAVQTTEPYDVMPFRMTMAAYFSGQSLWRSLIKRYAECQAADWWPGVAPRVLDFDVMPWAQGGDEETDQQQETF